MKDPLNGERAVAAAPTPRASHLTNITKGLTRGDILNIRRNAVGSDSPIVTSQLNWLKPEDAWSLVGLRKRTFQNLRSNGTFIDGIHYQRLNGRTLRYNKQALQHWLATKHNSQLHQEWCRDYLAQIHRGGVS